MAKGDNSDLDALIKEVKAEKAKPKKMTAGAAPAGFDPTVLIPIFLALLEWWKNRRKV